MRIRPVGSINDLDLDSFSVNGLLLLRDGVRHAFVVDDQAQDGPKPYGVRETPVWREWANALDLALAIKAARQGPMVKIDPIGAVYLDPNEFSVNEVLLLHGGVRHALAVDDNTKVGPKPYGVRETPVWRELAYALEVVLAGKMAQFTAINWDG